MQITIQTIVNAPVGRVWEAWVQPDQIVRWNFATDDWICPQAVVDLAVGGKFSYRMEARDGSMGFDFAGEFIKIQEHQMIVYDLDDGRGVTIEFLEVDGRTTVTETFEAEDELSGEQQRQGWQLILNNFKALVEGNSA